MKLTSYFQIFGNFWKKQSSSCLLKSSQSILGILLFQDRWKSHIPQKSARVATDLENREKLGKLKLIMENQEKSGKCKKNWNFEICLQFP